VRIPPHDVVLSWVTQYLQKALETDTKQNELLLVFPFFPETMADMEFSDPASKKYAIPFQGKSISGSAYH
jgi:hypothetical protein